MKKRLLIIILITLLTNSLLCSNDLSKSISPIQNQTIIVASVENTGFIEKHSSTTYAGYLVNYLNTVGEIYNLNFQYILVENNEECLDLVRKGLADISCFQYKTENLEKDFDFSYIPTITLRTNLYTTGDNTSYYYEDFENFNSITIGARKDLPSKSNLIKYSEDNNFKMNLIYFNSEKDLYNALISKEVDAIATDHLIFTEVPLKQIGLISYAPAYIITRKGNPLMDKLNSSINEISKYNSDIFDFIYDKHLENETSFIAFTRKEDEFIKNSETLKVGLQPNSYVNAHYENQKKEFSGIIIDYLKEIEEKSNLKFEFMILPNNMSPQKALSTNYCDLIPELSRNDITINDKSIFASKNYLKMKQLIAIKNDNPVNIDEIKIVSCPKNYQGLIYFIKTEFPDWEIVETKADNILNPLLAGIVDAAIGNEYELRYLMQNPKYADIVLTESFLTNIRFSIGMKSDQNPYLLSVINKTISNIPQTTVEAIKLKGVLKNYKYTFFDSYYVNSNLFNFIVFLLISIIISLVLFVLYQKVTNKKIKKNEAALSISNEKFEKANKAKTEFLASMSHDLRTPMNAIIGLTEISKNALSNSEQIEEYINKIDISSKYLLSLINDILDISAIEDGKLKIYNDPFSLKELIHELASMYDVKGQQTDINFLIHIENIFKEYLIGDYYRIKQILTNLLSNAFKFTPKEGTIELIINETLLDSDTINVNIAVKDTGIGIPKEDQIDIFEKFVQSNKETANKQGGSGLGLSIVNNLIKLMNGSILLESEEGIGSTFSINIPLQINKKILNTKTYAKSINVKMLILDSDLANCLYICEVLKTYNIACEYALNFNESTKLIQKANLTKQKFNLLIIDKNQLDYHKDFFLSEIAQYFMEKGNNLIVSSYDISYLKKIHKSKKINFYLQKPIFPSSIDFIINNLSNLNLAQREIETVKINKLTGLRVLLCEDNQINQLVGKKLLENFGCKVTLASNGLIAYETFMLDKGQSLDVILMDIRMPELNGFEATEKIRNSNTLKGSIIPIYAMTANVMKEDIEKSHEVGMNGHIGKPIDTMKLYNILKEIWIEKNRATF